MLRIAAVILAAGISQTAEAAACREAVGAKTAARYVKHCKAASPATRPPCHADNPCDLILDEIRRGCTMLAPNAPGFCASYRGT